MVSKNCDCNIIHKELVEKVKSKMPDNKSAEELSDLFKIMGDKTRILLLWALDNSEMCVCDLANLINMTKSAVSHQLKTLKEAKLVKSEKKGKHVFYSLIDEHVKDIFEKALEHILE